MNVAVLGLWHLGSVTAACVARAGHTVLAYDPHSATVEALRAGRPPVFEPGLSELISSGLESGKLRFTTELSECVRNAELVWITFDTPVDEDDVADAGHVERQVEAAFPYLAPAAVLLCSSQLPVGTVARLESRWRDTGQGEQVSFACSPENLRLGKAIDAFTNPDRIVVGVRDDHARARLTELFAPIAERIEWMSVESAEMTKHALNAFLATSVTFINEVADLCELVGADAKDVERGLRSERRIGRGAYLSPGGAFAGGTLARDVGFLRALGDRLEHATPLMDGVLASNGDHGLWARRKLAEELGDLRESRIAVWGLTYKAGTDTLRRSSSVELCRWLVSEHADVHVHDPAAGALPSDLPVARHNDPIETASGAKVLVVATSWPLYRNVDLNRLAAATSALIVLDANGFLEDTVGRDPRFKFRVVGQSRS